MRRIAATALIIFFSLLLSAPLFGPDADTNLPPCCRRHGKHHCAMRMSERPANAPGFASVTEKCPCFPAATCAAQPPRFKPEPSQRICIDVVIYPAVATPAEVHRSASSIASHPRRGPPTPLA
ncbi:MAG TPA: hypothetical protein VFD98_07250 [Terracidiphilus sp.]|nr:hypothetical protein [Terracidiphilus sp.]